MTLGDAQAVRLIPACAGKTVACRASITALPAHPRVCGENAAEIVPHRRETGSSPRVRGKRFPSLVKTARMRLIPACAGKTYRRCAIDVDARAHPRVCGENT